MRSSRRDERGNGLLGTVIGVSCVLAMLGFAVNVALGLWTRSTVDAVAYDTARRVATAPVEEQSNAVSRRAAEAEAIQRARDDLGALGSELQLEFEAASDPDLVVLRVRAPGVALLPRLIEGGPVVGALDRRIVMRREVR